MGYGRAGLGVSSFLILSLHQAQVQVLARSDLSARERDLRAADKRNISLVQGVQDFYAQSFHRAGMAIRHQNSVGTIRTVFTE